ncbi:ASCH domain-containing protein [Pseudalkalibacillus salsuginis]|uniref:ASCH domain-containing protein n=1 Tax=Pseudalkalibacillus salsuginis TaxID=2910972 RepID=UPI001F332165|nr:ASCH domain-containing protein [Pseudalkalibacillus salsuginis]MCF6409888.1 ASCH domain-containing protein [Pseudalkalibacillus salsuginis]
MNGLLIKSSWIDFILDGKKTWEIRGSNTKIRSRIALIKRGTGMIFGTADLIGCRKISFEEYKKGESFHCVSQENGISLPYKNTYAWILTDPNLFETPHPYDHPKGAVIWVKLDKHSLLKEQM